MCCATSTVLLTHKQTDAGLNEGHSDSAFLSRPSHHPAGSRLAAPQNCRPNTIRAAGGFYPFSYTLNPAFP